MVIGCSGCLIVILCWLGGWGWVCIWVVSSFCSWMFVCCWLGSWWEFFVMI